MKGRPEEAGSAALPIRGDMHAIPPRAALHGEPDGLDSDRFALLPGLDLVVWRAAGNVTVFYELEESGAEVDARHAKPRRDETRLALTFGLA
jgi:hypothetical protein